MTEKLLQQACTTMDVDIISLDCAGRIPYYPKHSTLGAAISRGICFEISYAGGIRDTSTRRQIITNAASIIRASRGRGLIISSESAQAIDARGPYDVINLAVLWGLSQEKAQDAVRGNCRGVVVHADRRRNVTKGTVRVNRKRPNPEDEVDTIASKRKL